MIAFGSKVGALESYSAYHFDEISGDLIEVEEIYDDGWMLQVKLKSKVWEESNDSHEDGAMTELLNIYLDADSRGGISSQSYLFELSHFCHFEAWEQLLKCGESTDV